MDLLHWTATKCAGFAGTWEVTVVGAVSFPTGSSFTVGSEPLPGQPVEVITDLMRFDDTRPDFGGYEEAFILTFYADGSETSWGAPAGAPAMGIDELAGGRGLPITVGSFC